jgi:hypothetical protein
LSWLHIVALPPGLVAVTLHWIAVAPATSVGVTVVWLLVDAVVVGEPNGL